MDLPVERDWVLVRGDTSTRTVVYSTTSEPVTDPALWRVRMQVRRDTDTQVWLEKTDAQGITVTEQGGKLVAAIGVLPGDTAGWGRAQWVGRYDVEVVSPGGVVRTVLRGGFIVEGDVTVVPGE